MKKKKKKKHTNKQTNKQKTLNPFADSLQIAASTILLSLYYLFIIIKWFIFLLHHGIYFSNTILNPRKKEKKKKKERKIWFSEGNFPSKIWGSAKFWTAKSTVRIQTFWREKLLINNINMLCSWYKIGFWIVSDIIGKTWWRKKEIIR